MTVCFFSAQYLPTVGGVERYTWNLARQLLRRGHHALVVTSALPGLPARETDADGIEIFRLPVWPLLHGRFPVPKPGRALRKLTRALWERDIHFVCIQTRFYVQSLYAARAAKKRGIPAIVIDHSTGHMPMGGGVAGAAAHLYEHAACRLQRHWCGAYYGVSKAVCRWLAHFHAPVRGALYNAADPQALEALLKSTEIDWRARLGLPQDTLLVAFAGRAIPEKGVRELVEAFSRLARPDAALVVAGDGPLLDELRAHKPARVFLEGAVPYAQTLQLLRQADVYCLPTYYAEGFPTTFLEAALCGCAVVTTHTGGTEELFLDDTWGLCVDAAPRDTLAERLEPALKRALDNPAWRAEAARKTRALVLERFTWDAVCEALLAAAREMGAAVQTGNACKPSSKQKENA